MIGRRMPPCPYAEQAVGWSLHALEPDEEVTLLKHLPHCAQCRELVDGSHGALALLGGSTPMVDPPPGLKADLLKAIADTPQFAPAPEAHADHDRAPDGPARQPAPSQPAAPPPTPSQPAPEAEPPTAPVPPAPRPAPAEPPTESFEAPQVDPAEPKLWRRLRRPQLALLAAVLVAVLGIGGLAIRNAQLVQQRDTETAQSAQLARVLAAAGQPGVQHAILATQDGQAMAAVLLRNGQQELISVALPPNPSDHSYVLWGIDHGSPRAIETFDVTPSDSGSHAVGSAQPDGYTGYAISLEPGHTAPQAPSSVMASGLVQG